MTVQRDQSRPVQLPPQAVAALLAGSKIEAIKIVRQVLGVDLKDAKGLVDTYVATDPVMRLTWQNRAAQSKRSWLGWVVLLVLVGWLALRFLSSR